MTVHTGLPIDALAGDLHDARRARSPIPTLMSRHDLSRDDAYLIQERGIELRERAGERVIGGKLGFTSVAMQRAMGVDSPNYGWLTDAMILNGRVVHLPEFIHPKVEPEIAFVLKDDLGSEATADDVLAATEAVTPCLEIVDSRYIDFRFQAHDNIADNSSAGMVVLGAPVQPAGDLSLAGVVVTVDGELVETAAGAAALDHPAAAVAWMARAVAGSSRHLQSGDIVISGGLTAPIDLASGMQVRVEIDRIGTAEFAVKGD